MKITKKALSETLKQHTLWLADSTKGIRAYFRGADLRVANLTGANLTKADLTWADLRGANFTGANLTGADLTWANLTGANLTGANLTGANTKADLRGANFTGANLTGANFAGANFTGADLTRADLHSADLHSADLHGADLRWSDLRRADLRDADLQGADLTGADLAGADLTWAKLPDFRICPEEGAFVAWKRVSGAILKLEIRGRAVCSLAGRKCRTDRAFVFEAFAEPSYGPCTAFQSLHDPSFTYEVGKEVTTELDEDIRVECTKGIHFFMTRKEAEQYGQ